MKHQKKRQLLAKGFGESVERQCKAKAKICSKNGYPTTWFIVDQTNPESGNLPMHQVSGFIEEEYPGAWTY